MRPACIDGGAEASPAVTAAPAMWATSASLYSPSRRRFDGRRFPADPPLPSLRPPQPPRPLCSDRKGMLDQFRPRAVVVSTLRVSLTQASQILARYATDELREEVRREEMVAAGKMSVEEADEANAQWEEREWSHRWSTYPLQSLRALVRYHAVTLLMRSVESLLSTRVSPLTLDRLTRDPFRAATDARDRGAGGREIRGEMWTTCLWAGAVGFGCEWAAGQAVLAWGWRGERAAAGRRRIRDRRRRVDKGRVDKGRRVDDDDDNGDDGNEEEGSAPASPTIHSLALRSARLLLSRLLAYAASAAGGAAGSQLLPGWGTLIGSGAGDGMAAALLE